MSKAQVTGSIGRWALVAVWMGVIFWFSAQPDAALNFGQPEFLSKATHVIEYAILGWLIQRARGDKTRVVAIVVDRGSCTRRPTSFTSRSRRGARRA